jgi:DNA-binding response OmpR family regulator
MSGASAPFDPPIVAILDTSEDIVDMLRAVLEGEGWIVVADYVIHYRRCEKDLVEFLNEHNPRAILFDIGPPYEANWNYFQAVRALRETKDCAIVVTTTNKARLEEIVGPTNALEFVGKPYDISDLIDRVKSAVEC